MHFCFFVFKGEKWKNGKGKFKKKLRKIVLLGGREPFFCKNGILRKLANTTCVRKEKRAFSSTISVFGQWYFFCESQWPYKITEHYKNRGFGRHRGKPQMALLVSKVAFCEGASKGGFTICNAQKLCSAENTILLLFWAKHSYAEIKDCKLKNKKLPKIGGYLPACKKVFFFGAPSCYFSLFLFFFWKKPKKAIFLQFWSYFYFVPPKGLSLNPFFFLFRFFSLFSFLSSLARFHIFLCFLSINPKLLSFLAVFFCFCFCFHGVCFSLSVFMLVLFLVCHSFVF